MGWIKRFIKWLLKNIIAFIVGMIAGFFFNLWLILPKAIDEAAKKAGLGIIAIVPVLFLLYSLFFCIIGGIAGIATFNIGTLAMKKILKERKNDWES